MTSNLFTFFKRFKRKSSIQERLQNLLYSLSGSFTSNPHYQTGLEYFHQHEWELALDSLIELESTANGDFPKDFWFELWFIAATTELKQERKLCCEKIKLQVRHDKKINRIATKNNRIGSKIVYALYLNIAFENLYVEKTKVSTSLFINTEFKNSSAYKSVYLNCDFIDCKFYGRKGNFGRETTYINCNFVNCNITGVTMFEGPNFVNCSFSGRIKNAIINDDMAHLWKSTSPIFDNCDFSDAIFDNLNLYGSIGLRGCLLPNKGIVQFKNDNDSLFLKVMELSTATNDKTTLSIQALFSAKSGQNPIIIDTLSLDFFFETGDFQHVFNSVTSDFRITQ